MESILRIAIGDLGRRQINQLSQKMEARGLNLWDYLARSILSNADYNNFYNLLVTKQKGVTSSQIFVEFLHTTLPETPLDHIISFCRISRQHDVAKTLREIEQQIIYDHPQVSFLVVDEINTVFTVFV